MARPSTSKAIAIALCLCGICLVGASTKRTLELHLVCDKECYEKMKFWDTDPQAFAQELVKEINIRFAAISLQVILVDLEIWNEYTVMDTTGIRDMFALRRTFGSYRLQESLPKIWSDASVLLTGTSLPSTSGSHPNGVFIEGTMCEGSNGAGVVKYTSQPASHLAATVVHELGHGLGMPHDSSGCCSQGVTNCIMAEYINNFQIENPRFSACSVAAYEEFLESPRGSCLEDLPPLAFDLQGVDHCGNGVVEDGEECDCPVGCVAGCCDCCDSTCHLKTGAQCWEGDCCNSTCQYIKQGTVCSPSSDETCDVDDTCTGSSSECPSIYSENGLACTGSTNQAGYCYSGQCLTRNAQCSSAWNPGYKGGVDACYRTSLTISSSMSHCGESEERPGKYDKCTEDNERYYKCGLLQCKYGGSIVWPEWQIDQARHGEYNIFVMDQCLNGDSYYWESARGGPLMIADGTKCGDGMICMDTDCVGKSALRYAILDSTMNTPREVQLYCGDGRIDGAEECDCGAMQCDCCDENCKLVPKDGNCRFTECKTCDGETSQCPSLAMTDYVECGEGGVGQCFRGQCVSLENSCKRYFGSDATPAEILYKQDLPAEPGRQYNAGGYLLYDVDSGDLVEDEFKEADNGRCGVLLCTSYNFALVFNARNEVQLLKTFTTTENFKYRYAYYSIQETHVGPDNVYRTFYPVLADYGSPCTTPDNQKGYCNTYHLSMSMNRQYWFWRSKCLAIPT